jgi:hypothetical protein
MIRYHAGKQDASSHRQRRTTCWMLRLRPKPHGDSLEAKRVGSPRNHPEMRRLRMEMVF